MRKLDQSFLPFLDKVQAPKTSSTTIFQALTGEEPNFRFLGFLLPNSGLQVNLRLVSAFATPLVRLLSRYLTLLERFPTRPCVPSVVQWSPGARSAAVTRLAGRKPRSFRELTTQVSLRSGGSAAYAVLVSRSAISKNYVELGLQHYRLMTFNRSAHGENLSPFAAGRYKQIDASHINER